MLTILHPFVPETRDTGRQRATWAALAALDRVWPVLHYPVGADQAYEQMVRAHWRRAASFVICEQDIEPTLDHLLQLDQCPEPICAWAYLYEPGPIARARLARAATLLATCTPAEQAAIRAHPAGGVLLEWVVPPAEPVVHRVHTADGWRMATAADTYADMAGFGLIRFRSEVLEALAPAWPAGPWSTLDTRVTQWLHGHGWRVHLHWDRPWPVHHHFCACHADDPAVTAPTVVAP
jgi:hypothetical protein